MKIMTNIMYLCRKSGNIANAESNPAECLYKQRCTRIQYYQGRTIWVPISKEHGLLVPPILALKSTCFLYLRAGAGRKMVSASYPFENRGIQLTRLARTAPPRNTMCLRRGGSSILTLNFWDSAC